LMRLMLLRHWGCLGSRASGLARPLIRESILFPRRTLRRHASIRGSLKAYEDVGAYRLRRSIHPRRTLRVEGPWVRSRLILNAMLSRVRTWAARARPARFSSPMPDRIRCSTSTCPRAPPGSCGPR
jgi:hypothetical protein